MKVWYSDILNKVIVSGYETPQFLDTKGEFKLIQDEKYFHLYIRFDLIGDFD